MSSEESEGQDVAADWRDRWKAFHQPVRVGPLWIGPPWHDPPADANRDRDRPGSRVRVGADPTTQLCVELMLELEPASVVDFGCGSRVLVDRRCKARLCAGDRTRCR